MKTRHSGFSLIELLVVIGIIAILAAILFPMLTKTREKAKQVNCVNHAGQLDKGFKMYGVDWDNRYPSVSEWGDNAKKKPYLYFALAKYISNNFALFQCPADTGEKLIGGDSQPFWKSGYCSFYSSWAWPANRGNWVCGIENGVYVGYPMDNPRPTAPPTGGYRWPHYQPLSKRPVLFDGRPWHWGTKGTTWTSISGRVTVLWCDGHATMANYNDMIDFMDARLPKPKGY